MNFKVKALVVQSKKLFATLYLFLTMEAYFII